MVVTGALRVKKKRKAIVKWSSAFCDLIYHLNVDLATVSSDYPHYLVMGIL